MRKQMPKLDAPLNADERYLHAIAVRLDRVIELLEDKLDTKEVIKAPEVFIASEEEIVQKKRTTKKK